MTVSSIGAVQAGDGPGTRLAERLRAERRRAFVGRFAELALFRAALAGAADMGD